MNSMKKYLLATVASVVLSLQAHAGVIIVMNGKIYASPSAGSVFAEKVDQARLKNASFLKLAPKQEDYTGYFVQGVESLPGFSLSSKPSKPVVPEAEGCGTHPMKWLPRSKVVGKLKKKAPAGTFFMEVPEGFKSVSSIPQGFEEALKKKLLGDGGDEGSIKEYLSACLQNTRVFAKAGEEIAYSICSDELNEFVSIFHHKEGVPWASVEDLTITEMCP
ncbi:hypothetical protein F0U61_37345 [Archangium violaceum]|uniref:hypothetical protein n=1 Tax=Archangium violaceum TaxID=83451 RepID=UPI002B300AF5|nr:hypothetical protein F0U61_37345 [Archangium violaceum]